MELCRPAIAVLGRYPRAGKVKTRLMPLLGATGCARLQEAMLLDTVERMAAVAPPASLFLAGGDEDERAELAARLPPATDLFRQEGDDLGQRMNAACMQVLKRAGGVVLTGTDAPTLPLGTVRAALEAVAGGSNVFGPVEDGGYCLLGMRHAQAELFADIDWGSETVMEQSLERLAGRDCVLLGIWYDVDQEADLLRLEGELQSDFEGFPARTAALLAEFRDSGMLG